MSDEYKPESVVLSDNSANMPTSTPTLSGTTATLTGAESVSATQPGMENFNLVTGADGQTYAVMNQGPFEWNKFFIGLGIPVLFVLAAWGLMMIAESSDPWDYVSRTTELNSNPGTEYTGAISLDGLYTEEIEGCWLPESSSVDFYISCYEDWENEGHIIIERNGNGNGWVEVGSVSTNGTVNYDDGTDHGESFTIEFDFRDSASEDTYNILWGLSTILCWLGPLSGIGLAIYGFASGTKAMGIGSLSSIVVLPAIFVVGCFAMLFTGGF